MLEILFLLLPVAAGYGWVMGRNSVRQAQRKQSSILSRHYFKGLNFLLSDQPDKAVDTLIKMINIDSDTVETHIAMGNFFRHRGEIDRAIKVHQNLVTGQTLTESQRHDALKELGKDYLLAGFLERAENAYLELLNSEKHFQTAQTQLFSIYQTTKEWARAIELAENVIKSHADSEELYRRLAHFYCEQAQLEWNNGRIESAEKLIGQAASADEHAVRPWLMAGKIAMDKEDYTDAMEKLMEVPKRDISWFSEAVPLLEQCADKLGQWQSLEVMLEPYWQQCATAYVAWVKLLAKQGKEQQAIEHLLQQLRSKPTMKGFKALMSLYLKQRPDEQATGSLTMLRDLVDEQITQRPKYRCTSCGFSGRKLYWLCPSCKKWGVLKPIKGLDGE